MNHPLLEKGKALALALAVAAPMAYVLQISMGIWLPAWVTVAFSLLFLVVIELVSTNRVTAIGIPAGAIVVCLLLWWAFNKEQREFFVDFFWWSMYFLGGGGDYPLGYGIALSAIATFLVTLYTWLFGRKFFCFPLVLVFVVGFLLLKWFHGLDPVLLPGLFAVAGLIALWAKSFQRKSARQAKKKLNENGVALYVLPLALAAAMVCYAAIPTEQAAKWQNRQVYDLFERVNNFLADYTGFQRQSHTFSIARFGFMPLGVRLGGPTKLSDEEVLEVTASRPILLRGIIYNDYTGQRWEDSTNSTPYRFGNANNGLRDSAFDLIRPVLSKNDENRFLSFVSKQSVSVYPIIGGSSALFVPYRGLTDVSSQKFLAVLPRYNAKGEVFSAGDVHTGYGYDLTANYLDYEATGFDSLMERLMELKLEDPVAQAQWVNLYFTALPTGIEQSVATLTKSITKDCSTDWDKAVAIREFLYKNFVYTLSPSTPPEDMDFVSWFINHDRQGYCTYYATAMAVMARIAGIPSRYCEGYAMPDSPREDSIFVVRGNNAHAWAELYFEGIGWIPFDATPSAATPEQGTDNGSSDLPIPVPTIPPITQDDSELGVDTEQPGLTWQDFAPYLWILPVVLIGLFIGLLVFRMVWAKVRVSLRHITKKYADKRLGCAFYYHESVKLLEYYNYPLKPGETPMAYATRIDRWLRLQTGTFLQVADVISRISYSDFNPTEQDVRFLSEFCHDLIRYTYHTVGPWFYLMHRVLGFRFNPRKDR